MTRNVGAKPMQGFSDEQLSRLSDLVRERMGLTFPRERWDALGLGVSRAAGDLGFPDVAAFASRLLASPSPTHLQMLAGHLTVGETYFFRERPCFDLLEGRILPELIRSRSDGDRSLRFWSAGCCTGEEPYSLAMLLHRMIPDLKRWNVFILATDINPNFLRKAQEGVYGEWSFRGVPAWIRDGYFRRTGKGLSEIVPAVGRMVSFAYLNLAEDVYPSLSNNTNAMDVILCRNVLMYFSEEKARQCSEGLSRALMEGGWLVVGASETAVALPSSLKPTRFPDALIFRKESPSPTGQESREAGARRTGGGVAPPAAREKKGRPRPFLAVRPPSQKKPGKSAPDQGVPGSDRASPGGESATTTPREAIALYREGRYPEAARLLMDGARMSDDDPGESGLLARCLANQGKLDEALAWCERAISRHRMHPELHYIRAAILQEQGESGLSAEALKRSLYLAPDFVLAHYALGVLQARRGRAREAFKHLQYALELLDQYDPESLVPESEGLTAARLAEIVRSSMAQSGSPPNPPLRGS